ncbi:protease inhibitor I42 family protein [Nocardia bhagyanarayanae]|uniref:Inhibitor of cysteine peptidase n=1 Tax=Nocardia bhagyanarayanae TaxID=1215925 RepID=A0A543FBJ6_9NOCA|nr:protease inhibitor I42 family protein [Nocardia bhagyanarayanae]TQM31215.1 inhibitor of cysteine peptidase [Nocardia bhagyanarayanae]
MRKSLVVLLFGVVLAACGTDDHEGHTPATSTVSATTQPPGDAMDVTEADSGQNRALRTGQQLIVTLPANPSTGYGWRLAALDQNVLRPEGEPDYRPDADRPIAPGSGGSAVWTFVGNAAGVTELALEYARPWEHGVEPAQKFTLRVEVK